MAEWQGKTNAGLWGIKIFVFIINRFGLRPAYLLLRFVAGYYFLFSYQSNKHIYYYFNKILGLKPLESIFKIYRNYYVFGQTIIDKVALLSGANTKFTVNHDGGAFLDKIAKGGKGGILISGHLGNWEIAGQLLNRLNTTFNILMYENERANIKEYLTGVEKKKKINIIAIRENEMGHIIELNNAFLNNELVVMHGDRYRDHSPILEADFLGKKAKFPAGPFILAVKFRVPVTFVFALKEKSYHYHFYASDPVTVERVSGKAQTDTLIRSLLQQYISELEKIVHQYPEQWFNYYAFWNEEAG